MGKSKEWLPFSAAWRKKYKAKLRDPSMTDRELLDREVKYRRVMIQTSISAGYYIGAHIVTAVASAGATVPVAIIQLSWQAFGAMQASYKHKLVIEEIYRRNLKPRSMTKAEIAKTALWATLSVAVSQEIDNIASSHVSTDVLNHAGTHIGEMMSGSETVSQGMQGTFDYMNANSAELTSGLIAQGGGAALSFVFDGLAAGGVASAGMLMTTGAQKLKDSQWLASATQSIGAQNLFGSSNRSTALMGRIVCQRCGSRFTTQMKVDMQQICNECQLSRQTEKGQGQVRSILTSNTTEIGLIKSDVSEKLATLHLGSYCDGCLDAIIGTRYSCLDCPEYDLCEDCFYSADFKIHTHNHQFSEVLLSQEEAKDLDLIAFRPTSHNDIYCDGCKEDILGIRMRCSVCPFFDLCHDCYHGEWGNTHSPDHLFEFCL